MMRLTTDTKSCFYAAALLFLGGTLAMGIEEASYEVLRKDGNIEIREYAPQLVAETLVSADFEDASNVAFRRLFNYISGANTGSVKIAMTSPVAQEPGPQKIAMTSPVSQQGTNGTFAVSFVMPTSFTMDTLPTPTSKSVTLREIPARTMVAIKYSGRWTEERYKAFKQKLDSWIEKESLDVIGEAVWARYNPPFTPWFLRRNEILIPITPISPGTRDENSD